MGNYAFEHLNSINLKRYSQTCSNNHLCKLTKTESSKQIPIQVLLHKKTTCLMQPATTFFDSQIKKNCLKQQLQNFVQQKNAKKT